LGITYWRPITDLTTLACSSHPIDLSAGETIVVVKTTPPSHAPARMTCSMKLGVHSRLQALVFGARHGLVEIGRNAPLLFSSGSLAADMQECAS